VFNYSLIEPVSHTSIKNLFGGIGSYINIKAPGHVVKQELNIQRILCYAERSEASLQEFCKARPKGPSLRSGRQGKFWGVVMLSVSEASLQS
jgi:hypothetical protein